MPTATDVRTGVREALDRFVKAYDAKDAEAVMRCFSSDDDLQLVGTGADEVRLDRTSLREQVGRDFSQADRMSVSYGEPRISSRGDVAWVYAPCQVTAVAGGETMVMDGLRLTAVLERHDGDWLMRQAHLSAPMAGQESGHSFPTEG